MPLPMLRYGRVGCIASLTRYAVYKHYRRLQFLEKTVTESLVVRDVPGTPKGYSVDVSRELHAPECENGLAGT